MMEDSKQKSAPPETPGYKKFGGAKLVPPPAPIPQLNDEQGFPVFLGVGIALSIAALLTVFILAFFSHKTKVNPPQAAASSPALSAGITPGTTSSQQPSAGAKH
jgi:hypothetical protein